MRVELEGSVRIFYGKPQVRVTPVMVNGIEYYCCAIVFTRQHEGEEVIGTFQYIVPGGLGPYGYFRSRESAEGYGGQEIEP